MKITTTPIEGLLIIEPQVFKDERGYFYESYNIHKFREVGIHENFIQDNQSLSQKGAIRGLHFQAAPFEQGKLVRVVQGAVIDVVVDIRKASATYGHHFNIELTGENMLMFYIPAGFAHGFETLADNTIFQYKCTNVYNKSSEGGVLWNDPDLNINWQTKEPIISIKDQELPTFNTFVSPF
ncbi:MAG: dTDP-4-dehydrorhamnose 3,5-epimerase [Bacteroidetes bacterium]|jgi:dTDP-4-dehydrorhamnose 3,5-epimerase|nr:dTDP-4-dehydrorhamnose 3,5-epimerase [Bacteroidota bacterium]